MPDQQRSDRVKSEPTAIAPFLLLLFLGTICSAMIVPFMGYFLVEGLGHEPQIISVYSVMAVCLTVLANRSFAERIDNGDNVFPLIGIAALGSLLATLSLALAPNLWTALSIGVLGFGISSSAISTMFSLGGNLAERHAIERSRFNAYMRATSSTAWMLGPAITFLLADQISTQAVFVTAFSVTVIWLCLWWLVLPHNVTAAKVVLSENADATEDNSNALWLAAAFIFCLSLAHSLTFTSLPLFYVQEVGLPGYAPGIAFSMKTFIEVIAVFSTPVLITRFGMRNALLATTLLAVATIQFLALVSSFPQMLFGAALEGLYYGLYAGIGISYIQSFVPERPARATAIYWNCLMISGLMAGPVVGLIAQVSSFQTVLQTAVGVAFCAVLVLMFGSRTKSQSRQQVN